MSGARLRRLQLAGFALMLTLGLLAGLARLGWISAGALAGQHGPLMLCAGLGSLIGIERAAASSWRLAWLAPGFSLAGGLTLLLGGSAQAAGLAFLAAGLAQIRLLLPARLALPLLLQLGGLGCWLGGSLLWICAAPMALVALIWAGLPLLTIAGSRLGKIPARPHGFALAAGLYLAGLSLSPLMPETGLPLAGLGLLGQALWLLRRDPACRARGGGEGLRAACLQSGYLWLGCGGLLLLSGARALQGLRYDMSLHSLLVGYTFSLMLGHLPQLLPRLLGRAPVYHPLLWLPALALGFSLLLRQLGGLLGEPGLRAWGGLLNAGSLAAFMLMLLWLLGASGSRFCLRWRKDAAQPTA